MNSIKRLYSRARSVARRIQQSRLREDFIEPPNSAVARSRTTTFPAARLTSFSSLSEFLSPFEVPGGVISIWHRGLPFDMSLSISKGDPLVVVLHGAADTEVQLPWLSGGGVLTGLSVSRLSISDPSLYLTPDLNLSWFAGSTTQPDLTEALTQIITKVQKSLGSPKVILFGGSGGGFASLRLAPLIPHSVAIVMNPQTDIEKYHEMHVKKYVDLAWNGDAELMRSTASTKVIEAIRGNEEKIGVFYLQNTTDSFHVKAHLEPFIKAFHGKEGFYLLKDEWRDGHTPPPKELISQVINAVVENDLDKLTGEIGFIQL